MQGISDIIFWKNSLGLLPIKQFSGSQHKDKYILLNGGYEDFCLDLQPSGDSREFYFSAAWSSNTKNFVSIEKDKVAVFNWKANETKYYSQNNVIENLTKFYNYLINNSFRTEDDIVPFVISIFKKLRNLFDSKSNPVESLDQLFLLLASLENKTIDKSIWGIDDKVSAHNLLERYILEFKNGVSGIAPKLDLIIRHSMGMVFQEAQKEVLFFDKQMTLFSSDTLSDNYQARKILYSSIHHTPSYLARCIVENALNQIDLKNKSFLKILDPSCGSSEFLLEVLKQLEARNFQGNVRVYGWDSSEIAIKTSRFLLSYEKRNWGKRMEFVLKLVTDSLNELWDNDFDLILMNPPFVSWVQLGNKESRLLVRETLNHTFDGKPNQASAFFYKAILSLNSEGVIGTVIPSSLLVLDAYNKLRKEIKGIVTINLIGRLGNYVFEDALVDVSIIIANRTKSHNIPLVIWTNNEKGTANEALREYRKMLYSNSPSIERESFSIYRPSIDFGNSWKPISVNESELLNRFNKLLLLGRLVKLEKIFNVQQGIRTGNNQAFKITKSDFNNLRKEEQIYFRPVIDNESISCGVIRDLNYIWYPYNEDGLVFKTEDDLIMFCPDFYKDHFLAKKYKELLINRARKSLVDWWTLSEHRAWLRVKYPRLASTEFGTSMSFAFDTTGEYVIERGNGWLPRKEFKDFDDYYFYLSIFSSQVFDKLLSIYSKQLLSGWDLGKKYTKEIPIPKISNETKVNEESLEIRRDSPIYLRLVQFGKTISKGEFIEQNLRDNLIKEYIYPVF